MNDDAARAVSTDEGALPAAVPSGQFRWLGPGTTGFLLPCDEKEGLPRCGWSRAVSVRSSEEARGRIGPCFSERHGEVLRSFFDGGGRECRLAAVPREPRFWLGENGGPGERSGIHAFLDLEDVGSVVVPPVTPRRLEDFLAFGARFDGIFLFLEEKGRRAASRTATRGVYPDASIPEVPVEFYRPLPNALVVKRPLLAGCAAAAVAAFLERTDLAVWRSAHTGPPSGTSASPMEAVEEPWPVAVFAGEEREPVVRLALSLSGDAVEEIRSWRLWNALRRSLDHGSRWVVFEPNHPLVWRRLEREARAFLHDLSLDGVLPPWGGPGLEVRCEPAPGEEDRVVLTVRARMAREVGRSGPAERARPWDRESAEELPAERGEQPSRRAAAAERSKILES